ncbi:MAG: prolyl oligopeptidase family serine peptidase [Nocardioidaceae bacterium]|nr:prolyl oligopeptidase family serine peptidase [Nocardioidaceae bacterium]
MRLLRTGAAVAAALLAPATLVPLAAAHADPAAYTVTTLHFKVTVGPTSSKTCDIVGDLYTPAGAGPTDRMPAILTTNGFGGSKNDQAGIGKAFSQQGYVVLSYSGLGFGGSSCAVTLDDPDYDGKAGSQLISYLGGKSGIAYLDAAHKQPAPVLDDVELDGPDDPRVGTIGGSYGGSNQFAIADVDPRLDTIVPMITWNDLSYSLGPNNTDQVAPGAVSTTDPGSVKLLWAAGFSIDGMEADISNKQVPDLPCPNFATWVCPALVTGATTGFLDKGTIAHLRHASVASYMQNIKVPTLLIQGENDTLFNLNEAAATYRALKAQGTPVQMIWQSWGHSSLTPATGEIDMSSPDPATQYETARISDWFAHYLKGESSVSTGPDFAYYRDWVSYTGDAAPAYASASSFPVGSDQVWRLSGKGSLVTGSTPSAAGSQSLVTPVAGLPTSLANIDALSAFIGTPPNIPGDLPGTEVQWDSPALTAPVDVVGSPRVTLKVGAPTAALTQALGPAGQVVLMIRVADVGPDGKATLIHGLEAPVRVPNVNKPFTVTVPAIVHRFAAGHKIRLEVAGGSIDYRGNLLATPVSIASGATQTLTLPTVPAS